MYSGRIRGIVNSYRSVGRCMGSQLTEKETLIQMIQDKFVITRETFTFIAQINAPGTLIQRKS